MFIKQQQQRQQKSTQINPTYGQGQMSNAYLHRMMGMGPNMPTHLTQIPVSATQMQMYQSHLGNKNLPVRKQLLQQENIYLQSNVANNPHLNSLNELSGMSPDGVPPNNVLMTASPTMNRQPEVQMHQSNVCNSELLRSPQIGKPASATSNAETGQTTNPNAKFPPTSCPQSSYVHSAATTAVATPSVPNNNTAQASPDPMSSNLMALQQHSMMAFNNQQFAATQMQEEENQVAADLERFFNID